MVNYSLVCSLDRIVIVENVYKFSEDQSHQRARLLGSVSPTIRTIPVPRAALAAVSCI